MATTTDLSDPTIRAWTYTTGGYPSCLQDSFLPAPSAATPLRPTQLLVRNPTISIIKLQSRN